MSVSRKGLILAGGTGSRLWPVTIGVSKQLLPVHDKPMIYYPLSVLMLSGIREIAIITTPDDQPQFVRLLGDGSQWGLEFIYLVQNKPNGLAEAFILGESFLDNSPSALVLGDNLFFGHGLPSQLTSACAQSTGGTIFGYQVADPENYGVVTFDDHGKAQSIIEKPNNPNSNYAVTGLYFLDDNASELAKEVNPSKRGELEITDLLTKYLEDGNLSVERLGRGYAWLDTGTHESLLDAGNFVRTLQKRQGLLVGSPDEIALDNNWVTEAEFEKNAAKLLKSDYGKSLMRVLSSN